MAEMTCFQMEIEVAALKKNLSFLSCNWRNLNLILPPNFVHQQKYISYIICSYLVGWLVYDMSTSVELFNANVSLFSFSSNGRVSNKYSNLIIIIIMINLKESEKKDKYFDLAREKKSRGT